MTVRTDEDRFADACGVADAVLYEGYLLYPYRRSSGKNRVRWQFGVLAPRSWIETNGIPDPGLAGAAESWFQQAECLAEAAAEASLRVRVRFLQVLGRQVYAANGVAVDHAGPVLSFDEGVPREFEARFDVAALVAGDQETRFDLAAEHARESLPDGGHVERSTGTLQVRLVAAAERAEAPFPLTRVRVRIENATEIDDPSVGRGDALRRSLVATHLLLGLDGGAFLSSLDPPAWASAASRSCRNAHVFPVLAGPGDAADVLLCAPIIMYDHPSIAPESPGDLHDATEIDEILSLRTLTLTDAEKAEARATDPRAAAIVDRVDGLPAEVLSRLHGAVRELRPAAPRGASGEIAAEIADDVPDELPWWDPRAEAAVDPHSDAVLIAGRRVGRGAAVRLRPRGRRADAQDMFLAGRSGTVHAVLRDVDGSIRLAVTVDGDPAAELQEWYGRFFHFAPEEVEPL